MPQDRDLAASRFPSKRDRWISVLLWVAAIATLWAGAATWGELRDSWLRLLLPLVFTGTAALTLWILYGASYTLESRLLRIRSGPFRFQVPLGEIDSVTPSRNPLSSPACSLDRLQIRYRGRRILISPEDKDAFLRALVARCPHLVSDGTRALRPGPP